MEKNESIKKELLSGSSKLRADTLRKNSAKSLKEMSLIIKKTVNRCHFGIFGLS